MLVHAKTKEEMDSLVVFAAEAIDGLGQVDDMAVAKIVVNRLLEEHSFTPAQMLIRIMQAPAHLCADMFIKLADFYEYDHNRPELWAEFGEAAGEIHVRDYMIRAMEDTAFPIIRRALGIDNGDPTN